jgi:hypothetical protein
MPRLVFAGEMDDRRISKNRQLRGIGAEEVQYVEREGKAVESIAEH